MLPEQARYNIAAYSEMIADACADGRRVQPWWTEALERAEESLRSPGTHRPQRSRSLEPSTRPSTRRPPWYLSNSEETSRRGRSDPSRPASEAPELRETGSGFRVELTNSVCKAIEQEVLSAIWGFDSREIETGGYLYALYWPDEDRVGVMHASGPGHNGRHGSGQVRLGDPNDVESGFDDTLTRAGLVRVGDWHSHPNDDPIPSDADLRIWGRHSDDADVSPYAGVIVTPGEVGWMTPELHAWITREDDHGLLVCEPGRIEERFG